LGRNARGVVNRPLAPIREPLPNQAAPSRSACNFSTSRISFKNLSGFFIDVASYDWNCLKYITPRLTAAAIEVAVAPLRRRIADLESEVKAR
jgi:hypothetical protein